jgi:hypothetical protein
MSNSFVHIIIALLVIGLVVTLAGPYLPPAIITLIIAVAVVWVVICLLRLAGMLGGPPVA